MGGGRVPARCGSTCRIRARPGVVAGSWAVALMAEGWGVIRPGDRKAHYYVNGFSLCGRVGFYFGPTEDDASGNESPDDHKECRRLLVKRQATPATPQ